ncbi:MAG: carboxylesterase family protein [Chitinophagaceae bacterium]
MKIIFVLIFMAIGFLAIAQRKKEVTNPRVKTGNGLVEGVRESGILSFKGLPFAAPPVGNLRWKEPQPIQSWHGVRKADKFGPRAMQRAMFGDMVFRSDGMSEDCLYLNVWTPAEAGVKRLPVLVYFYGGGLMAGDGSEPRYDGASMARKGVVAITVNYRLNLFGFLSHPELTKESPHQASGNYGFMDQAAAMRWVKQNIAAFGGDPDKITIAGESAGSISVSAQMVSPLSKHLIAGAIGESGSLLGTLPALALADGEQKGSRFAELAGAHSLEDLRSMTASQLLDASANHEWELFGPTVDGYFLPDFPEKIYASGKQAQVPLLAGWNSEEASFTSIMGKEKPTKENYERTLLKLYGDKAAEVLKRYSGSTDQELQQAATDLASDRFIGFSTWKWSDTHSRTGGKPVYRYLYCRARPDARAVRENSNRGTSAGADKTADTAKQLAPRRGAVHSAEIEYALGNLATNLVYDWQLEDYQVSRLMQSYFVNFVKTGNPNGSGLPTWPAVKSGVPATVMHIDVHTRAETEKTRDRYLILDQITMKQ